ncbi:MAG: hypothetical protein RIB60_02035 [Phycisphaerales bacterium]
MGDFCVLRLMCIVGVMAGAALAQDTERSSPPTLDELLGLDDPAEPDAETDAEADADRAELDRQLGAEQIGERLDQAAALMDEIAARMRDTSDVSITTQRQQERVVSLLDQIIDAAQQQQQQQQQQQSSSSSSQQQQQQQQQPNQPQAQPQPSESTSDQAAPDTQTPSSSTGVQMRPGQAATGAAWGSLPERLRDALTQGLSDRYSSLYERATESYYRRLAEEESQ